jgi:hypothetical protein
LLVNYEKYKAQNFYGNLCAFYGRAEPGLKIAKQPRRDKPPSDNWRGKAAENTGRPCPGNVKTKSVAPADDVESAELRRGDGATGDGAGGWEGEEQLNFISPSTLTRRALHGIEAENRNARVYEKDKHRRVGSLAALQKTLARSSASCPWPLAPSKFKAEQVREPPLPHRSARAKCLPDPPSPSPPRGMSSGAFLASCERRGGRGSGGARLPFERKEF